MKCDLCGTKESRVTMNGIGYCEDSINKLMAERYGLNELPVRYKYRNS